MVAILNLIASKHPSAFETPLKILYVEAPHLGWSFEFVSAEQGQCYTSVVQSITPTKKDIKFRTKNSVYRLTDIHE